MTNDRSDFDLLDEYARRGSQTAFAELAKRYGGLVYTAAMRQVHDPHAAEDVSQAVFMVLARRAATLRADVVLGAWLLSATRFVARDYLKSDSRRRRRERAVAVPENAVMNQTPPLNAALDDVLDEALMKLSAACRDVLVLRYFQDKSFEEISRQLQISEQTARQRVSRGLAKLRQLLGRMAGVQVKAEGLGLLIAATAVCPAPEGLVTKLATASTATAASSAALAKGAMALMAYAKSKTAVTAVLAILLTTGGAGTLVYYVVHNSGSGGAAAASIRPTTRPYLWPEPPATKPAYTGPPIVGYARTPDGKPVADARVTYDSRTHSAQIIFGRRGRASLGAHTRADGRFELMPEEQAEHVVVQSSEGFAMVPAASLASSPNVVVRPYGRLQGIARIGSKPAANARITYVYNTDLAGGVRRVSMGDSTTADAEGRFEFDRIPPGKLSVHISLPAGTPAPPARSVEIQSGSIATVMIGGTGRPVVGRFAIVPPEHDRVTLTLGPAPLEIVRKARLTELTGDEREKLRQAMRISPEYQAWLKAPRTRYAGIVDAQGRFRFEDVPTGNYELNAHFSTGLQMLARAMVDVIVPDVSGGQSDDALDIGPVPLTLVQRLEVGQIAPELIGNDSDGKQVKLGDFRGKFVLFFIPPNIFDLQWRDVVRAKAIHDLFRDDDRFAMIVFHPGKLPKEAEQAGIDWPMATLPAGRLPEVYGSSVARVILIDPAGRVLATNMNAPTAMQKVEEALARETPPSSTGLNIDISHLPLGQPPEPRFADIPAPQGDNAARSATFSVVDGVPVKRADALARLHDGKIASTDDAPSQSFFFEVGTLEGRLKIDLGRTVPIERINTYSRHKGPRGPQLYVLYATDGTAANFDPNPRIGADPAFHGWTKLAFIDTRPKSGPPGGTYAVSLSKPSGTLGNYKYLLFEMFPTETADPFGHTFYSEIQVLERK